MSRRWPTLGILLRAHGTYTTMCFLGLMVVAALVTGWFAIFSTVDQGLWHGVSASVPRWLAIGLGVDAINTYLRLHMAHGRTRADFLRQLWAYFVALALLFTAFVAIWYVIEHAVYALGGWPTEPAADLNLPVTFSAFFFVHLLWTMVGALLAVAFTRHFLLGVLAIPLSVVAIAPAEVLLERNGFPVLRDVFVGWSFPLAVPFAAALVAVVLACAAIWGITRDFPLRPRVA